MRKKNIREIYRKKNFRKKIIEHNVYNIQQEPLGV